MENFWAGACPKGCLLCRGEDSRTSTTRTALQGQVCLPAAQAHGDWGRGASTVAEMTRATQCCGLSGTDAVGHGGRARPSCPTGGGVHVDADA